MISTADADKVIARSKRLVAPMAWSKKLNHSDPVWHEYRSALEFEDDTTETPEGLFVVCLWKQRDGVKPEIWYFGLFCSNDRIYAIDVHPLSSHKNKAGRGRPFFQKTIIGSHEHTWSVDGGGYAEPIALDPADGPTAWRRFIAGAGIADEAFVHPDKAINEGQQVLDI